MELGQPGGATWAPALGNAVKKTTKAVKNAGGTKSKSSGRSHYSGGSGGGGSRSSGSGGGGGGGFGGGGGGSFSAPKPVIPSIAAYLGTDSTYQNAVSGGKRTLADYLSELTRRRGEAGTQYKQTLGTMGRDHTQQLDQLRQEYASRGLINSGLFGQKNSDFEKQYQDQLTSLGQQQSGLLADLLSQQKNYQREYDLALQQAKQEALARRAAQYSIG